MFEEIFGVGVVEYQQAGCDGLIWLKSPLIM